MKIFDRIETDPEKKRRESRLFRPLIAVLSLILGFAFWSYVAISDNPNNTRIFSSIPVKFENLNVSGYTILSGSDVNADVTISGRRNELSRLDDEDFSLSVDLSDVTVAGNYLKEVRVSGLPSGMEMITCSPRYISVDIDVEKTVSVPVLEPEETYTLKEGVRIRRAFSQDSVSVKGPQQVLDTIVGIRPVLDLGELTEDVVKTVNLRFVDANGNEVTNRYLVPAQNTLSISYTLYKEKTVPLMLNVETVLSSERVTQTVTPSAITVQGPPNQIDDLEQIWARTVSTAEMRSEENTYTGTVILPEGLEAAGTTTYTAIARLSGVNSKTVTLPLDASYVEITGLASGLSLNLESESVNVTVRAANGNLSRVSASSLGAVLDLSGYTEAGSYTVDLEFNVSDEWKNVFYVVGTASVDLTLGAS